MKTILCDVDGVLADCVGAICKEVEDLSPDDIKHWELSLSMTRKQHAQAVTAMGRPGFCQGLEWYAGAEEFLWKLQEAAAVYAVTSPFNSETWERERKLWLKTFIHPNCILSVPTPAKTLVRGDILIEDHPGTAYRWLQANPEGHAVLIDRPWNQSEAAEYVDHERMHRAHSYRTALIYAEGL